MGINNARHIIGEIDGVRCTVVEAGTTSERAAFLRQLLEFNNFEVREMLTETSPEGGEPLYTVGVTDIVFNPVFAVFDNSLNTPEGGHVTPGYWLQECTECDPRYWLRRKLSRINQ